jgi:3'(2'), 5'-bisphosphate nucleotidase
MTDASALPLLARQVCDIARAAGAEILDVYEQGFDVELKGDGSPLTAADRRAHELISASLAALTPQWPVLSEESATVPYNARRNWTRFWLVDPLDGTKEFVKRNGEFTVNIALIEKGRPVLGVVHTPVSYTTHWGWEGGGAFRQQGKAAAEQIKVRRDEGIPTVVASRSHGRGTLKKFLERGRLRNSQLWQCPPDMLERRGQGRHLSALRPHQRVGHGRCPLRAERRGRPGHRLQRQGPALQQEVHS